MSELIAGLSFAVWGVFLGVIYFGGLWLTVRRMADVKFQGMWMMGSFLIRNLLIAAGFYPVVLQGWRAALFFLTGFVFARIVLTRRIKIQTG